MHCEKDFSRSKVYTLTSESASLNRRGSGNELLMTRPTCGNQAAAFCRCLTKVQENMASQLKVIQSVTSKGKSSSKLHQVADELDYAVTFNRSITQAMALPYRISLMVFLSTWLTSHWHTGTVTWSTLKQALSKIR